MTEEKKETIEQEEAAGVSADEMTEQAQTDVQDPGSQPGEEAEQEGSGETQQDAESSEAESEKGASGKQKKSFLKKKEKKDKKDEKIAELTDRLQRQMAEFDNFRKRTEKEKSQMYQIGAKDVIEKILPVVDNFERGLAAGDEGDPFVEGMNMIYKQILQMLGDLGVTPIEAIGQTFDPNLHNAVMHTEDDSVGENVIVEELQKGYLYKDNVVRFSMVKVAN